MIDLLVLGDVNPDLVLSGDVVPRFGQQEQLLDGADLVLGGSGAIVAHGAARLGTRTRLVACVGDDLLGRHVRDLLVAGGVDPTGLVAASTTGLTVVLSTGGDRAMLTYPGSIPELTADLALDAIDRAADEGVRHVHVSSYFLLPKLTRGLGGVLEHARGRGLGTSLDTNFDPVGAWTGVAELLPFVDLLLPNATEVSALAAALGPAATSDPLQAARRLAGQGPTVVVKLGRDGAVEVTPDGEIIRDTGMPVVPVDTTGAGDTFVAAYLDGRLRGLPSTQCLRRACRAGALSTAAVGGTAGQPDAAQLDQPEHDEEAARR